MLEEFKIIFIYFCFSIFLSILIVLVAMLFVSRINEIEKISAYECGFHPFDDSRTTFDVRFYLVAILFIIFDLEIIYLFPWSVTYKSLYFFGYISMLFFLFILIIGYIYEWKKGAIEWV